MKLSHAMLEEGRALVRGHDLEGLVGWIRRTRVPINIEVARTTFGKCFASGNTSLALKMFDAAFLEADPTRERLALVAQIALILFVMLGLLGGVVSLFRG